MFLPEDFTKQMQAILGEMESKAFFDALAGASPISIRYNKLKKTDITTGLNPVPWAERAYYLEERPNFTADPSFHGGAYYVQEASSMFVTQALQQHVALDEPLRVLDLCAAPGGKSTLIADLISQESLLLSNEVIKSRAQILSENIQKWGRDNIWVSQNDPLEIAKALPSFFDVIVVDAPCSGEGMFRKAAHSVEEWSLSAVQHCALRQQRILHDIWAALRPGGILVYSTCTYNESENESNLLRFREDEDFESLPIRTEASWQITETTKNGLYAYRFYPHKTKGEGFFLSVLRKAGDGETSLPRQKKTVFAKAPKEAAALHEWINTPEQYYWGQKQEQIFIMPEPLAAAAQALESNLRIVYGGTALAEGTRKGFNPLPSAALYSGLKQQAFPITNLDLDQALHYLHLDNIDSSLVAPVEGWQLVQYNEVALGWIKKIQNRVNNYYPNYWKIRLSIDKLR